MNYQSHNPQFDFLKPTHILNGFFTSLVEQYRKVLHFDNDIKDPLVSKMTRIETHPESECSQTGVSPSGNG